LKFENVGFSGRMNIREPGKKPSEQGKNQQQTQPTYDTKPELNPGHIGGSKAPSPLCQPCSPLAWCQGLRELNINKLN